MRVIVASVLVFGGALAACGQASTGASVTGADAGASDAAVAATSSIPTDAPAWLDAFRAARLAKLTDQPDRATSEHRRVAREYLRDELLALGLAATVDDYGDGANVVARLTATHGAGDEWILVGAHYDSFPLSPGADDNASGTVAVLAVARIANELPRRDRGLIIAFFDQEEIGLVGSKAFAAKEAAAGTKIVAVHTIDEVGWDGDGDRRFELGQPTPQLLVAYQASAARLGITVIETPITLSDHEAFRENGFAAVGITEEYLSRDRTPHAHKPADTADTVDGAYHALAARLVADVVARQLDRGR